MSIIENKYQIPLNKDYQGYEEVFKDCTTQYDNNNTPRSTTYYSISDINEERKRNNPTFLFWTLVVFLLILAVGNLILTFVILGVLRLGQGMESIELVSEDNLLKFFGSTDLDMLYKVDGHLDGFADIPVEISADTSSVFIQLNNGPELAPSIHIGMSKSVIQVDTFQVTHPKSHEPIFSTEYPNFGLPKGVKTLKIETAETRKISSPIDENLSFKSDTFMKLKGNEGTDLDGKEVIWFADQDVSLKSVNKSIILSGSEGVHIDVKRLPIATAASEGPNPPSQYKICVCMPSGRLFRVPIRLNDYASCHLTGILPQLHPCL